MLLASQDHRDAAFRAVEELPGIKVATIRAGNRMHPVPQGRIIDLGFDIGAHMAKQRNAGLIIVQGGAIRFERYALGYTATGRWTSFSVAKSITSTLVGAALQDGYIGSLDDRVSTYLPALLGSALEEVTVRQLLTMSSGVKWNEDYEDPASDVSRFNSQKPVPGEDVSVSYMKALPREAAPGTTWVYKTGETNLIGVLVSAATGKRLSDYLSEKIWKPFGMEDDAVWMLGATGHEIAGCCISARLRDFARFGLFMMGGGVAGGQQVLPDDWIAQATTKAYDVDIPGRGYGYQWWTNDDGSYSAQGIYGQGIFVDAERRLVIASNGNWPVVTDPDGLVAEREAFYKRVQAAVDREQAA
ncbi:serine hydrolase domain-containing protein [Sphingopyxis granuli]|uniref:serine hydrolase domain-containing protein n=1 Tax=Sphingopyxis granuli TaxID=267128 RepID=UPI001BB02C1F|nr:serine hydrolase domain-containing protein [Sphingopyxis granuli]QUM71454.1 beta-lactamase family protein [Sphingopyxis granuli]